MDIQDHFLQAISSQKPFIVKYPTPKGVLGALSRKPPLTLAPMNTDIRFADLPEYQLGSPSMIGVMSTRPPPPEKWDWRHKDDKEDKKFSKKGMITMSEKKDLIETPRNQQHCGSCWAVSTASVISDMFVARGMVNYSPKLSTTYILTTYPGHQCGGGNPSVVFDKIKDGGIASQHCINYNWCNKNNICDPSDSPAGQGGKEFTTAESKLRYINNLIPEQGGACFFPDNKKLYYIAQVKRSYPQSEDQVDRFRLEMKHHIMEYGPVVAGYIVFNNFPHGDYSITKGIYLEGVDYDASNESNTIIPYQPNYNPAPRGNMIGGHAIAVIGWGVEDDVTFAPGKKGKVPYWYCRNSWGEKWGKDNGYFKFAMFPFNRMCGFDHPVQGLGGFVIAKAYKITEGRITKQIPSQYLQGDKDFFKSENDGKEVHKKELDYHKDKNPDDDDDDDDGGKDHDHEVKGSGYGEFPLWAIIVVSVFGGLIILSIVIWLFYYLGWRPTLPRLH